MKNIRTACVSTYCTPTSYGSILQSYALKKVLLSFGMNSYILDYRKYQLDKNNCLHTKVTYRYILKYLYNRLFLKKIKNQIEGSQAFIDSFMDVKFFGDYSNLLKNKPIADVYITGSDQVFHPDLCSPLFFLDFVSDKTKKHTYAVSMGKTIVPDSNKERFSRYLTSFSTISVREKSSIEVLKQYCNADFIANIDPTFLLSKDEWREIEVPYDINKPYILVYPLYWDISYNEELRKLYKNTGLQIIVLSSGFNKVWGNKKLFDVNVQQFVWLIDHAEAVVSSSFHGIAMSTIFNKQVAIVNNPLLPSRISDLCDLLGLQRINITELLNKSINYENINKRIIEEKEKSINYLRGTLGVE